MNQPRKGIQVFVRIILLLSLASLVVLTAVLARTAVAGPASQSGAEELWRDVAEASLQPQGKRDIIPQQYRTVAADITALDQLLAQAPMENLAEPPVGVEITLPLPDGRFGRFHVIESPVMAPELAAKFPEIKTYIARGLDDPTAGGRLDRTPAGFHAMIFTSEGTFYIDPYSRNDITHYMSYYKRNFVSTQPFVESEPLGADSPEMVALAQRIADGLVVSTGSQLRTYRLAVAATGEYTQFHGGTVPAGMAAIVTAVNRVTGIYEREVAVRMVLIANNDQLIYTNGATDPYTNNNGGVMLMQNQNNLDAVIGSANYDIGHVFSTGGGGVAFLGVPCQAGLKARGVTGLSSPVGDPFYVDYVAHEMGHQYGAEHTFNGNASACSGVNRNASTAYEPGSGSTIMAYAGICGSQDLQANSDDYFHNISFVEIVAYTTTGAGNSCAVITATGNSEPVVNAGGGGFTIPIGTPFTLTGSATDPDGDPLTYNWEQFDLGPAGHPDSPVDNAPLFRSFPATNSPSRTFPQISDIVNGTHTIGEILPTITRPLNFRLTVRDNHVAPSAGGVAYDTLAFDVTANAGPFAVTYPNTAVTWTGGTTETVTWDVANTDVAPVNCTNVNIHLSTDGGYTYPILLDDNVPNDGAEVVVVPNNPTGNARVRVECADNVFFDISNANFTIVPGAPTADLAITKSVTPTGDLAPSDTLTYTITVANNGDVAATATITDTFPLGLVNPMCNGVPGDLAVTTTIMATDSVAYTCTTQVDPTLSVHIHKAVDRALVEMGTAVTYTITVTNPSPVLTLTNVIVDDPDVGSCLPALGTPISLGPQASQQYICANVVITNSTTNTATVTAEVVLDNTATVSAPEDPGAPHQSNTVSNTVTLSHSASATVTALTNFLYIPTVSR